MCDVVQTERAWGKGRPATKVRENGFESEACPPDRTTGRVESLEGSVGGWCGNGTCPRSTTAGCR